jgi:hypothetical protein
MVSTPDRPGEGTNANQEFEQLDSHQFDRIVATLETSLDRRGALRVFGLAALGAVSMNRLVQEDAGARRRKKKKATNTKICTPGKTIATLKVPSNGVTVNSPALTKGQRYRVQASGFWNANAQYGNDACAAFPFANPNAPEFTYRNLRLGLLMNSIPPGAWGNYNTQHVYEQLFTGDGLALAFRNLDPVVEDNSGFITVTIECV